MVQAELSSRWPAVCFAPGSTEFCRPSPYLSPLRTWAATLILPFSTIMAPLPLRSGGCQPSYCHPGWQGPLTWAWQICLDERRHFLWSSAALSGKLWAWASCSALLQWGADAWLSSITRLAFHADSSFSGVRYIFCKVLATDS